MAKPKTLGDEAPEKVHAAFLQEEVEDLPINQTITRNRHKPNMRRVVFSNMRDPGQPLDFHYSSGTHPLKMYTLYHDKPVELPEEVIEHLENCGQLLYKWGFDPSKERHDSCVSGKIPYFHFKTAPKKVAA